MLFLQCDLSGTNSIFSSSPLNTIKKNTLIHIYMNKRIKSVSLVLFLLGLPLATAQATSSPVETVEIVQQTTTCKGVVNDENGEPLVGASVRVKGTTHGTNTSNDGSFSITSVKKGAVIVVSYIGYETLETVWEGRPLDIRLKESTGSLDEVVVVGYGVQKKVNLTGAVSTVKGEEMETRPVTDAVQALQGMVPGLYVQSDAGPGNTGSISLRGQGNLSGSSAPYVLVDGVEMSLSEVNPNDILNISVLKDAAACAVYGARAAYGVILVTTKRGEGGKMRVSYQGNTAWSTPTVLPDMVDSYTFAQYWNDGCTNAGSPRLYSDEKLELLRQYCNDPSSVDPWQELSPNASMNPAFENSESGIGNTNYFDLHYKNFAFKQKHNLSLSGGTQKAQYFVSGGYYGEEGILRFADIDMKRYNFNTSLQSQLTNWLKLRANVKVHHMDRNTPFGDGGLSYGFYHSLARFRPTVCDVDPNGNYTELTMIPYLQSGTRTSRSGDGVNATGAIVITPLKGWTINADYTYKMRHAEYEAVNVAPNIYAADGVTTSLGVRDELGVYPDGKYTTSLDRTRYQSLNVYTSYDLQIQKHTGSIMVGFQEEDNSYKYLKNTITGLYSTSNPNAGMGTGDRTTVDTRNGWATRGFFGRINYSYDERYLIELNGRYDASSRFASDHRWGFFPSVSAGWNIHKEKFMKNATAVNNLKLRASWGLLGNQAGAGLYTYASIMNINGSLGSYMFSDGRVMYTLAPGVVNPLTTWEKVESKDIGVDFGFFGNRLTGSFDVFRRDTKDMLGPGEDYPDFFGASAPQTNNACMRNVGWELAINWRGRIGKDITYQIGGSISDATAEVTEYENPTFTDPAGRWYKGRKVGEIWGYRVEHLIQDQAEADAYNQAYDLSYISAKDWTPGDVKYIDLNGDGKIDRGSNVLGDMGDMEIIGNTTPRFQYTINGSIAWKGLSLSLMFQGIGKRDWWPNGVYFWGCGPYAQVTVFNEHLDYWTESNKDAYYPKPYIHSAGGVGPFRNKNVQTNDRYLQSARYCRLKNITLAYDLPQEWIHRAHLTKVQVYFSGENLLTFTPLAKMFDPESIFTSNSYTSEGGKNYPMNKVLSVGLVVNL